MAESCNFCSCPAMSDSLLRDRIALCIQNEDARERLFQERKLDLKRGVDICRAKESATTHLQAFGGKHVESTGCTEEAMIFPRRTVNRLRELKCKFCSQSHVLKKELCPAWSKRCNVCRKINH
ncbi:unnamed protein product [Porites evermanni]|uniref:Recombination activating protein 1 n=1 Tax=Porites evermanni TaxID=104178 RepID=A0ABN8MKZ0_9CNID|nr:unnamed protein product [Porites evermanni]